ncbi:MAG: hypothetical protein HOW97_17985 [Catenulispora sp.]|nr:hypothetical protein [Catenulispora sp.]
MSAVASGDSGSTVLSGANPWPGDPAEYDGLVAALTDREQQADQVRSGIVGLIGDPALCQWLGKSADAFRNTLEPLPALLGQMVYAYGSAAQALRTYAQQVRDGQAAFAKTRTDLLATAASPKPLDAWISEDWREQAAVDAAAGDHTRALKACAAAIDDADHDLRQVVTALSDAKFHDFTFTFAKLGGHLSDLQGLEHLGGDLTGPAVDPAKILATIAYLDQNIDKDGGGLAPGLGPLIMLPTLQALSPAELDALVAMMSPEQLQRLNAVLGKSSVRMEWSNLLLKNVSASSLEVIQKNLGALQPDMLSGDDKKLHWAQVKGPLFGPEGVNLAQDLHQGGVGDCWFLSSIAAIAQRDPQFFPSRIHENPNGSYTVTLYQDGKPVEVTVDGQIPTGPDNKTAAYAGPGSGSWIPIYEKAFAQLNGGYDNIVGGSGSEGMHDLTGQSTQSVPAHGVTLKQVSDLLAQGRAVTADSRDDKGFFTLFGADGDYIGDGKVVTAHAYSVEKVDLNAHPPTITLLNPWGVNANHDGQSIGQITLTQPELQNLFSSVGATKVRP